jgi:hypothetical protein
MRIANRPMRSVLSVPSSAFRATPPSRGGSFAAERASRRPPRVFSPLGRRRRPRPDDSMSRRMSAFHPCCWPAVAFGPALELCNAAVYRAFGVSGVGQVLGLVHGLGVEQRDACVAQAL